MLVHGGVKSFFVENILVKTDRHYRARRGKDMASYQSDLVWIFLWRQD